MSLYYISSYEIEGLIKGEVKKDDIVNPERKLIISYTGEDVMKEIDKELTKEQMKQLIEYLYHKVECPCYDCIKEYINSYIKNNGGINGK